jgi:ABC-type Zn uptake system ZnuABC Zn-binding protein ZnuA
MISRRGKGGTVKAWHVAILGYAVLLASPFCAASQVSVLCSTTIIGDVVREIAGAEVPLTVLLPVGTDPHSFQAWPRDAVAVETASLIFLNGAGLETVLVPLLQAARGRVVDLSNDLVLRWPTAPGEGTADPHVWLNPLHVAAWAERIAESLAAADPENASRYRDRAADYRVEMEQLDAWIRNRVAVIPEGARRLVTDHEALGYFAEAYGFVQVGTVVPGYSTFAEPSARERAALEDAIRAEGVPCIFVGTTPPSDLTERIAADTGTEIRFLYIGSLSEADGPAPTYMDLMRFNVDQIVQGLTASP